MGQKVWTAEELESMDHADVDAIFSASIIDDPSNAPQELLSRTRRRIIDRIKATEPTQNS